MTNTSVARAARAEKKAEGDRKTADAAWRAAWWKTTKELTKPQSKAEVTEAYDVVKGVLGQSRQWLVRRRAVGKAFAILEDCETIEPRKAVVVLDAKVKVTDEVVEMLRDSEEVRLRDKPYPTAESLRAFSARLTGTAWSIGSDEEIEKALEAKPELARKMAVRTIETDETAAKAVVEVVAKSQPEAVGRATAKNVEATASYAEVRHEETEAKRKKLGVGPATPTPDTKAMDAKVASRNQVSHWLDLVHEGQAKLRAALQGWDEIEGDFISEDLVEVNASLVEAEGDAGILRQRVADKQASLSSTV